MWLNLQIFGFRALWSPYFFTYILLLGLIYYLITGPYRHKFGGVDKPTVKQQLFFYSGLLILYIVKGSPIDLLAHIMLSAHMVQMAIYLLVFPIFIILGIPTWLWEKVLKRPIIFPIVKLFTNPLISLLMFSGLFSLYHMPIVFDFSKSSQIAHTSISIILLIVAFFMWFPVYTPIKELRSLRSLLKLGYILANSALLTPACALIIFASSPLFLSYSSDGAWMQAMSLCVPGDVLDGIGLSSVDLFSPMSIMHDQQLGGIVMNVVIQIVYGTVLARVFFRWFQTKSSEIDPMPQNPITETHS